jgi:uncharacterized protein
LSERLPSKEQTLQYLSQSGCPENVIGHCKIVADLAVEIAEACVEKGIDVDLRLVETGALLHDIGRSKTHSVHHAIVGAEIAESLGLPDPVVSIIKRHVGGGITEKEAKRLGWPKDIYIPQTWEDKIVSYADKLIEGSRRVPIERTIAKFRLEQLPASSITRLRTLHKEMSDLIGDCKCLL